MLISEHDYRTARRANFHPIADALLRLGYEVIFISIRYSMLSLLTGDIRSQLWGRSNARELQNGVTCYLWRTAIHPFNFQTVPSLRRSTIPLYKLYRRYPSCFIDDVIRHASAVVIESGLGAILLTRVRALNPQARLIYYASDNLDAIGAHPFVQQCLEQSADFIDHVCLASSKMASHFHWIADRLYVVPHGFNPEDFDGASPNPYSRQFNAVSVGSMLFDKQFFLHAAPAFPDIQFHVIGARARLAAFPNLHVYGEMKFQETLPFIAHASFGIAPYRAETTAEYLCESSMKLRQYEYAGVPAVCPDFAIGECPSRFGYIPGDLASIKKAITAALGACVRPRREFLTWVDVAKRILEPAAFPDTRVSARTR